MYEIYVNFTVVKLLLIWLLYFGTNLKHVMSIVIINKKKGVYVYKGYEKNIMYDNFLY